MEEEKKEMPADRQLWRPQMKGEIGLVFACEFHTKSTSCHRFDEWNQQWS